MKVKYYRNDDLLVIKFANRPFKAAEKVGSFIIHYDAKKHPVLLEVLNASTFLAATGRIWSAKKSNRSPRPKGSGSLFLAQD